MLDLLKEAIAEWKEDKASVLAAALSFYTMISLAPLLVLATAVAGLFYGQEAASGRLSAEIADMVGRDAAQFVEEMVKSASKPAQGMVATTMGLVMLLVGASGVFGALQDALNTIWDVEPKKQSWLEMFQTRFLSLSMVVATGFLLLVSLVASTLVSAMTDLIGPFGQGLNLLVSLAVFTGSFAAIFKVLPDVKVAWGDVWHGAFFTSVLFTLGKFLIGLYLGHSAVASSYGAAGALAVILIWVYYSAQILFLGAEFTQVYSRAQGHEPEPAPHARSIRQQTVPGRTTSAALS